MKKRVLSLIISVVTAFLCLPFAKNTLKASAESGDIVILYTNDVHAYLNNDELGTAEGLSYAHLSQIKKDLIAEGNNVLAVDAGDHAQGSVYGAMDSGASVISIMNEIYDLATLGTHEFDYGIARTKEIISTANYPYLSCNFMDLTTSSTVTDAYKLFDFNGIKIGFVGITTPESITSTAPSYFQNENGEFIYDVLAGDALYKAIQDSIDALKSQGANYVIGLGHLGIDEFSTYSSRNVIQNVSGLNALIDGHSHSEVLNEKVLDKDGKSVTLTQTGNYFKNVGKMTINSSGEITTSFISFYPTCDEEVKRLRDNWVNEVEGLLGGQIASVNFEFRITDSDGKRMIRVKSANLGEFVADSYYYLINGIEKLDCDVAIVNGGGVRADLEAGALTYKDMKSVNPFGNVICLMEVSGQQILDALEWGARYTSGNSGEYETGAFLHTAGLTYKINPTVTSTVQQNEDEAWTGSPTGKYRVYDVKVYDKQRQKYLPLDKTKTYAIAGSNYTLRNLGGGFEMFKGATLVKDYIMEDYMALSKYALAFKDLTGDNVADITSNSSPLKEYKNYKLNYENIYGSNRIFIGEPIRNEKDKTMLIVGVGVASAIVGAFIAIVVISTNKNKEKKEN